MNLRMEVRKWVSGHIEGIIEAARFHNAETVRIGMTGEGIRPNYQLITDKNSLIAINGINHQPFSRVSEFDEKRISKAYSIEQLINMRVWGGFVEAENFE
ncbi:MAG: hypothetical protein E6X23_02195 [Mixta calida]|uniref:Uncharacterized protein n=1 Tax=Mixta calida TaxID=665913 RepID=A0ABM6RZ38_9GAMM|nr:MULTISPECIES: hypothetical protein [Mixta]MBS6058176.1 hypothetical protein [Pantoea sp.]AUY24530.1 hypothetical protein C2E16_06115 [Mixta calida]KAF0860882.1 hypothetical protein Y888_04030 [Mixta calida B021323]MCR1568040.1 hypothetical protein [Mixta sp.]MDU4940343.1 hypothetical protein [Mixta calida]